MSGAYPIEVRRLPESARLRLTWSDEHVAEYDYRYLRGYCPCAMCQGHAVPRVEFHAPAGHVQLQEIEPVGRYGLSFLWSDGHSTGIYRFDFLRAICPCAECRGSAAAAGDSPTPTIQEDSR